MEGLLQLVIVGVLVEAIWENFKMVWQDGKFSWDMIGALVVGIVLAFTLNLDILKAIGLNPLNNIVGIVATGILISRGGNYIHDLITKIQGE